MFLPEFLKKSIFLVLFIYSAYSMFNTFFSIHTNVIKKDQEYKEKILGLKSEKIDLEQKLEVINSEEFVEKEARTRLNMRKEGEEVYLISSNESKKDEEVVYTESNTGLAKKTSNFHKWMELLF